MTARGGGQLGACKHAGEFVDALFAAERRDLAEGAPVDDGFAHAQMLVCAGCYLRQVSDAQHLACRAEFAHEFANDRRHCTSDPRIRLIEDECADRVVLCSHCTQREADPRELSRVRRAG